MNFKHYNQRQTTLLPYSFDDFISEKHPVRVVDQVVESINIQPLLKAYSKEGNPSYHPKMLLKVMLYAYMTNTYSSRKIELAIRENINFMWLTGMTLIDHNTINRFRSNKLKDSFKEIFKQVVLMLASEGFISLKQIYTDGTKIEAQANRYTFVWGNSIKTNKAKMLTQLEELRPLQNNQECICYSNFDFFCVFFLKVSFISLYFVIIELNIPLFNTFFS
jgi:transposase